jgi:hypothetical protein
MADATARTAQPEVRFLWNAAPITLIVDKPHEKLNGERWFQAIKPYLDRVKNAAGAKVEVYDVAAHRGERDAAVQSLFGRQRPRTGADSVDLPILVLRQRTKLVVLEGTDEIVEYVDKYIGGARATGRAAQVVGGAWGGDEAVAPMGSPSPLRPEDLDTEPDETPVDEAEAARLRGNWRAELAEAYRRQGLPKQRAF